MRRCCKITIYNTYIYIIAYIYILRIYSHHLPKYSWYQYLLSDMLFAPSVQLRAQIRVLLDAYLLVEWQERLPFLGECLVARSLIRGSQAGLACQRQG